MHSCINCALKHVGKAKAKLLEARGGYPWHFWDALAQLSEAEDEIVCMAPAAARRIREIRKQLEVAPLQEVGFDQIYGMLDAVGGIGTEQVFGISEGDHDEEKNQ